MTADVRYLQVAPEDADLPNLSEMPPFRAVVLVRETVSNDWRNRVSDWRRHGRLVAATSGPSVVNALSNFVSSTPVHRRMFNRFAFLLFLLVAVSSPAHAFPTKATVPAPEDLRLCRAQDPMTSFIEQLISRYGDDLGYFRSEETVVLQGGHRTATQPREFAFAIGLPSGPYSASDVENLFLEVSDQWKNYKPLDQQGRADYDKRINDLVGKALPFAASGVAVSIQPATLVSIRRVGTEAYVVISLRQRKVTLADDVLVSTAVDASGIVLRGDSMLRLSLVHELREPDDVPKAEEAIAEWIRAVKAVPAGSSDVGR